MGLAVAKAVLAAAPGLDEERAHLYLDLVLSRLNQAAKAAFEALMQSNYEYQSDFAKKYYGQGRQEGSQEGQLKNAREAILDVFEARGIDIAPHVRQRIADCADLAQLRAWLREAVTADAADALLEAEPG